jgi:eukaryotic-like serine/threonine-protein kinase
VSLRPGNPSVVVPGYRLDRYEFLCPIAEGGMASVWVARVQGKHGFEKLFAIKTILPQYAGDERFQRMFLEEARISSRIEHPNVAQILDLGDEQGTLYLVMEWVDGDSLSKLQRALERKGSSIPYGISLRILADACAGLHAAHELSDKDGAPLGVVHRDISPQNILVTTKGAAKIIDFGVAKARDRLVRDTTTAFPKGKIHYMAPEQALGGATDRRADVWAMGAVLYHLVAGRPPFDGPNQVATLHMLTSGRPPLPLPAEVPAAVQNVIRLTLSLDPAKRYATAADLQSALEETMTSSGLATTIADVAAFSAVALADRAKARKDAVELALRAAAERTRVQGLLRPTSDDVIGRPPSSVSSEPVALAGTMSSRVGNVRARRRWPFGAAAVASLVVGATLFIYRSQGGNVEAPAIPIVSPTTSAPVAPLPAPSATEPEARATKDAPSSSAANSATVSPAQPPSALLGDTGPRPPVHSGGAAAPTRSPAPIAAPKPACSPPFYFNAQGNRVFKKECL